MDILGDLLDTVGRHSRKLRFRRDTLARGSDLVALGERLLSRKGEASTAALADRLLDAYGSATPDQRTAFLRTLADDFGPDRTRLEAAVLRYQAEPAAETSLALHAAAESRRQELFRRLNVARGGTSALIRMREHASAALPAVPSLKAVEADLHHLLSSWFNRGFLFLQPITWSTPANILEALIKHEAVHAISGWTDLRNRVGARDRRCYGFFHPQLPDEPLVFVEIALTRDLPDAIGPLLDVERQPLAEEAADTAVFYSISITQPGLAGISLGSFLIKQVAENLKRELPRLRNFVTLSPMPGFSAWLRSLDQKSVSAEHGPEQRARLSRARERFCNALNQDFDERDAALLRFAAAYYLVKAKAPNGQPCDPVARFHLGNGAELSRVNADADGSAKGTAESFGAMVNYRYDLDQVEANHERFVDSSAIATSREIARLLKPAQV